MNLYSKVHPDWMPVILTLINSDPKLKLYLEGVEEGEYNIIPYPKLIFQAFSFPPKKIKVVMLGKEPFVFKKYATGKTFAIQNSSASISTNLRMLFLEMGRDSNPKRDKELEYLEQQGVFLLNISLTVSTGGWEDHSGAWINFTKGIIRYLRTNVYPVFVHFGQTPINSCFPGLKLEDTYTNLEYAQRETRALDYKSPVVSAVSPQSPTFIGSDVFKITNQLLKLKKQTEIEW